MDLHDEGAIADSAAASTPARAADPQAHLKDHHFDVFLSYSRKDEAFAGKIEEALKKYRLPKDVKTTGPTRNRLTVFRDKQDLVPIGGDYWKTIEHYLERSAYLVLVCSPNARASEYVNHEIKTFLQTHEANAIIPLLLSGRPNNERDAAPDGYAFPDALCSALAMPLAVDFSEFTHAGGRVSKGRYHDSWYTLLAKLFAAERAEIERLDARRQARRRTIFGAAAVTIIAILTVALVVAVRSREEAIRQRDQARRLLYASNMNLAQRAFESGNIELGRGLLEPYGADDGSGLEDLRGFEWQYLWRLYNGQTATFAETDGFAFSPDGALFATATPGAVKIRNARSLQETAAITLGGPKAAAEPGELERYPPPSIAFAPDAKTIAYGDSQRVALIDIASGSSRDLPGPGALPGRAQPSGDASERDYWDLADGGTPRFSRDGKLLAVSYGCGMVIVFDRPSLGEIARLGDGPPASACSDFVEFSPDARFLAYGDGYNVRVWDTATRRDLGGPDMDVSLPDSVDQVESIAFSPDSRVLAIGDRSKRVVLWNIASRKVLGRLDGKSEWVSAIAFSPDGNTLYTGSIDQTVRRWDVSSLRTSGQVTDAVRITAMLKGHTGPINFIHYSPAGTLVATVGGDRTVKLWSRAAGREFDAVDNVAAISEDMRVIATQRDETITFFDARGEEPVKLASMKGLNLTLSPDGRTFTTLDYRPSARTSTITLWNLSADARITSRTTFSGEFAAFSADGRLLTALAVDGKGVVLWDVPGGRSLTPIPGDTAFSTYVMSRDAAVIVTIDKESHKITSWDAASASRTASVDRKVESAAIALSPDGTLLALAEANELSLWRTGADTSPVSLGRHAAGVTALVFSPDGRLIASGDRNGRMKLWDVLAGGELAEFTAFKDPVNTLTFSPDSRTLASGGTAAVKLYGMASMRELITLAHEPSPTSEIHAQQGGEDTVQDVTFSPDGQVLATYSGNGILRLWRGATVSSAPR